MNTFRERLRCARERFNLSQAGLADEIGVSRGVIFNLENKEQMKRQPVVIAAICDRLHVNMEWLMDGTGPMEPENTRNELLEELRKVCSELTEQQQLYILETIRTMQKYNIVK